MSLIDITFFRKDCASPHIGTGPIEVKNIPSKGDFIDYVFTCGDRKQGYVREIKHFLSRSHHNTEVQVEIYGS